MYEQEDRSAHKNCNRTQQKQAFTLLTPWPSSKTGHLLFLASSYLVAHCYCVLHYFLFVLFILIIFILFDHPLSFSLYLCQTYLVQTTFLEGTAKCAQRTITHKPLVRINYRCSLTVRSIAKCSYCTAMQILD